MEKALEICQKENIKTFIGKEKSPSCGIQQTSAYINGCECKCNTFGATSKLLLNVRPPTTPPHIPKQ
jgi:uncharacterized protein YbbK (DUF523 family)